MIRKTVTFFAGLAVLLGMSSAAMAAPDINNTTWAGWTDKGSSIATGVWARNGKLQDYQIFVTVFTSSGTSQIPGTSSGFTAGNRILGIGIRNNSGATGSPSIKLDPDNNSYAPSPDGIVNGQSSFSSNGDLGDPIVNTTGGNPTEITIRSANPYVASNDYYCPNGGNWCQGLGQPGFRGINPGTGVWKVFFDLDQMTTEFGPGGTRNILGKPTLDAGAFATGSTIKIAIGGLGGTEAVVTAVISVCGDGILQGSEQCDDGNLAYGDACTPSCVTVVESNFTVNTITPVYGTPSGNQVTGVEADAAPGFPSGSLASNGIAKTDLYLTPTALFGGPVTLGEIVSIRYWTKKGTTHTVSAPDWYMLIYTNPFPGDVSTPTWYGDRIGTEPYFSASLVDPANTWNQFTTDGATNKLRFFQSTQGAPGASFGSFSDPHWDTFVTGNSLGTSSPLAGHSILYFSLQTGSAWAAGFTGQLDGLRIETTGGKVANVNFEFTCTADSQCDTGSCATDTCNIVDGTCSSTFLSAGTECRASAGVCDTPETCTGSSGACPANAFLSSSTVCRADAGPCDVAENCTGSTAACPADAFEPNGTSCGDPTDNTCTNPDTCNGAGACLANHEPNSVLCRADAGACDVAEFCDGAGACPADAFEPTGTSCNDGFTCSVSDQCNSAGSCVGGPTSVCNDPLVTPTPSPLPSFDISAQARRGNTGFEAILFTPAVTDPNLNPVGTPAWSPGNAHNIRLTYSACTGTTTWEIDFNRDSDFLDAQESATVTVPALAGKGFQYANLFLQGNDSPNATATVNNFTINGTNLGTFTAPAGAAVETYFTTASGHFNDVVITGQLVFTWAGATSAERPRVWVRLANQVALLDTDVDTIADVCDNCPTVANTDQANTGVPANALGDACDCGDTVTASTEQCDDGNTTAGDCCSPTCAFEPSTTVCRAASGQCDVAENCTGSSATCPGNAFAASTVTCTGALNGGPCDGTDKCSGTADTCNDVFLPSSTVCRADAGQCDVAENCTGSSSGCPADAFEANTVTCSGASIGGACDGVDKCSGTSTACIDVFLPSSTVCRADAGQCDVAENCTGSAGACPGNAFEPNTTACTGTSQAGVCDNDASDRCSGSANTCVDAFKSAATVCRADAGQCDVAENCTGSAGACPGNAFEPNTTACTGTSQAGVCDNDASDRCSGSANTCVDAYKSAATVCRTDSGQCDVAENCTGSAGACPADAFEPSGTACGSALDDQCTNPDTCNGANSCLPNHEPLGTVCDDDRVCTINDACDGGGECDANATLFKDTCTYFSVGARNSGRILGHIGHDGVVTGDLCFDRSKVFAFAELTGNLVATASTGGKAHRFGEGSSITGDVVTDGAGVFSIKGALLPHVTPGVTSLAGGTVTAKDAVPGGFYNLSGTAPLVDSCVTARADLLAAATTIAGLSATQSYGDTTIGAGDTLTLTATVPGGLNVIDYARIRGGADVTINVDGGGNADSIVIVRVGSRFQLRENSVIQMTNGMQAKNFVLYVARGRTDIGNTSTVAGTIYGRGFVRLGEDVIIDGQVFGSGGKLEINAGVLATLEPNEIVLP